MAIAPTAASVAAGSEPPPADARPYPPEKHGWFALFAVVFATFVTFFDQTVFAMLAEKMKGSFQISDSTLGFLLGPVTVIAYVVVGIPLARLVDIFPRKVAAFMGWDALKAIWSRKAVFLPLFAALALSAVESQGLPAWRIPFMARTYGWSEAETGALLGTLLLVSMLAGIGAGGAFVTWMSKRYKDANIRATAIIFACTTVTTILTPLAPTGEIALTLMALSVFFGLAGAPAQNAAIQRIAPNEMRGQVSAFYLFMFTFFGALGSFVIGATSTYIVGDESQVWKAILITAVIFLPTATFFMWRGIKPYREEVERLEALGL